MLNNFGKCVKTQYVDALLCINLNEKVVNVGFYVPVIRQRSGQKQKSQKEGQQQQQRLKNGRWIHWNKLLS